MRTPILLSSLALAVAGCVAGDLDPGSVIDRDRVLGARVEVEGDASRASPRPGETVTVRWIVVGPGEPDEQPWILAVCAGTESGCTDDPLVVESGVDVAPSVRIEVPADLGDRDVLWIAGEIGESAVVASIPIAVDNHNPALAADATTIDGAPWRAPVAPMPPGTGCAGAAGTTALPALAVADGEVTLALAIDPSQRESFREVLADGTTRTRLETFQISHFTTIGTLDDQFSVIEGDADASTTIEVVWTPPTETDLFVPDDGRLVEITFVVRDGRGGLDVARRQACVVP